MTKANWPIMIGGEYRSIERDERARVVNVNVDVVEFVVLDEEGALYFTWKTLFVFRKLHLPEDISASGKAIKALRLHQWCNRIQDSQGCPECRRAEYRGHDQYCSIGQAIAAVDATISEAE